MKLVGILTAVLAVCGAAKLDRTYLPPASAKTAGGSPGALQTPLSDSRESFPKGSFTNDFQGVVVDAVAAGTRSSDPTDSGLGAPRHTYGSQDSKVGNAAFKLANHGIHEDEEESVPGSAAAFRTNTRFNAPSSGSPSSHASASSFSGHGFAAHGDQQSNGFEGHERPQAAQDRVANTLRFDSEVGPESYSYAFETDNGIAAEESAIATNGVQAQGGFSYTGDDGQIYSVTYTADEGGFQPKGDHLPTPPPIPEEILRSLEQNAREEAEGIVDDGSYDAKKYNEGSDYTDSDNGQYKHGSSGHNNQGSFSSANAFGRQSVGHGSQASATASSGRGRINLGNRNGDSSSDSSNVNAFTQASSFGASNNEGQNRFSGHQVDNNQGSSSLNQQHQVQGDGQFGAETGHGAHSSAFAGQGQNGHKQAFSQASFGQTNLNGADGSLTDNSGAIGNRFTSQLNTQFAQQSRFGNQAAVNRQGTQLNQYLPPLNNKNKLSNQVSQSSHQESQLNKQENVNQFGRGGSQQENNNNFQAAQSTTSSRFSGTAKGAFGGSGTNSGHQSGQQGSSAFGSASFGAQSNSGGIFGFKGASNAAQGVNTQASLNKFGSNAGMTQGFNTNDQGVSEFDDGSAGSGRQSGQQSASSAFGSASFGTQLNGHISGAEGAQNAVQSVNTQSTFNRIGSKVRAELESHTNNRDSSAFNGASTDLGSVDGQQSANSAFGSATFGAQSNKPVSSFGGSSHTPQRVNGASSSSKFSSNTVSDFGGASIGAEHQNSQQSTTSAIGSGSFGRQSNEHGSSFGGVAQDQEINGGIDSNIDAVHKSKTNGLVSSGFSGASAGSGHQNGQQSTFGVQSNGRVSGGASNGSNGKISNTQFGAEGSNIRGSNAFSSASFGTRTNSENPQQVSSEIASGEGSTQNRFGTQSNFGNSAHASAQFNQGLNVQQKQFPDSQFVSQPSSSQFGQKQTGHFASNVQQPGFNQHASASAQANFGANNDNSYHYNQPTKQFGVPTNSQQSRFQSTNQFNRLTQNSAAPSGQFGFQSQQQQNVANKFSQNANAAVQNNAPFKGRPQSSAQSSAQFQTSQQSQGFQKQTSAIPQSFQPLGQSSSSAQFNQGNEPIVPSQQYNGEIYEYNKPEQTLPSEKDQNSSSTISQNAFSSAFTGSNRFSSSNVAGKGEVFGGPRKAPSFDAETGYHY